MKSTFLNSFILAILILFGSGAYAQNQQKAPRAFTLKQAQDYAFENNAQLKNSFTDIEIAKKRVKENTAIGLPQVSANVDYTDFLNIPTTLIPNFFAPITPDSTDSPDQMIAVKFGTRYNASVSASVSQLLYSGQYLVGLQAANAFLETSKQKFVKDKMGIRDQVAEAYIGLLILKESNRILDSTYNSIVSLVNEAEASYKQGLIEDIDYDQLKLNQSNIEATITNTRNQQVIAYNFLKFLMGMKLDENILLTEDLPTFLNAVDHDILMNSKFDYNNNIDFVLFKKQEYLVSMQYKLAKTAYQPSMVAFLSSSYNAQRNSWNFFNSKANWFNTTNWGVSLSIPIWSSGSRKYAVDQAKLNVKKMAVSGEQLQTSLELEAETRKNDFNKNYLVFKNKDQGLQTADKIYKVTTKKYRQGISTSTDLNQKYAQFMQAESDYTQAMFDLLKAKIKLSSLLEKASQE